MMSFLALGIVILLASSGKSTFAVLWGVIAAGWFALSMWLWRQHTRAAS
jgi:hypothetical protein